ncbi:hypothetical protein N7532_011349 [Penicillium argentinense]|uniref:Zn(2)-C6 fungal-type domain-containing protein n=1 Tax=Penicillium argentinense TaxID=1131581 RepID=A0A9W9JUX2_9EURO|nr:uncharacterized protein N7532_011349 [Penicillium argentinense]KAJ5082306.1 hypothetical protein N7532_011349 [Penicillium argentinense]
MCLSSSPVRDGRVEEKSSESQISITRPSRYYCLVCRRRHVKCDEARPQCGPCAIGKRSCVYSQDSHQDSHQDQQLGQHESPRTRTQDAAILTPTSPSSSASSPSVECSSDSRSAPLKWFELLATDFPSSRFSRDWNRAKGDVPSRSSSNPQNLSERESLQTATFRNMEIDQPYAPQTPNGAPAGTEMTSSWVPEFSIPLSDLEYHLFSHFVRVISKWIDFHDPEIHFAKTVPHMALRNLGLMKALLALSARHLSLVKGEEGFTCRSTANNGVARDRGNTPSCNLAVRYYTESLHYLNKTMQSQSCTRSLDLIVTSILISTYEMIDGSNENWEGHIKGVFLFQRFQDNDVESGGLRSAVWRAWFQQDIWIALRERRRVYGGWRPKKSLNCLTSSELASRVYYLLGQCINYVSKEEQEQDPTRRMDRGNELLHLLHQWHNALPPEYCPLPMTTKGELFPSIWVNPPSYAAALQIHSLAVILVTLHHPTSRDIEGYQAAQNMLAVSIETICGIARSVEEDDFGANIVSLNCLVGAAMCIHRPHERVTLLNLLDYSKIAFSDLIA